MDGTDMTLLCFLIVIYYYFLGLSRVSFEYRTDHSKRPLVVEMEDIILAKMEIITKTRPKGPLVVSNLFNLYPKLIVKCNISNNLYFIFLYALFTCCLNFQKKTFLDT